MTQPDREVEVVVAHSERATLRVGEMFLKVDSDRARLDRELEAMALASVPTPEVLWHRPHVVALAALPGRPLGTLGGDVSTSPAAWAAAGAVIRRLHDSPLPEERGRAGRDVGELRAALDEECTRLVAEGVLPVDLVERNRGVAEGALRPWTPAYTHGDLQIAHVFLEGTEVTGIIDWSEAGRGDPAYDLATFSLGHEDRLGDLLAGYGADVDPAVIRGWWSLRSLLAVRWLLEHGFDAFAPGCEVDVLRARLAD